MPPIQKTLQELRSIRLEKLNELKAEGYDPFPYKYEVTHHSSDLLDLPDDQFPDDISIAGRIVSLRRMGKASFAHVQDRAGKLQIYVKRDIVGEEAYKKIFGRIDLGDFVGARGRVFRTRTGEVTLETSTFELLSKSLRPPPGMKEKDGEIFDPFDDKENRYRRRYLDLIVNPGVKDIFVKRAAIIKALRDILDENDFVEVETPALQPLYGGASARPFVTHHNALDRQLYLRIADELYLKRLIIGGFEKVYEMAKNFRNEGMDKNHNPEFTALEYYQAFVDYNDCMDFTESLVRDVARRVGHTKLTFQGQEVDLAAPFARIAFHELMNTYSGIDVSQVTEPGELRRLARRQFPEIPEGLNYGQLVDKLFGLAVEPQLIQPTFVVDYPKAISPLAKLHRDGNSNIVERFELFIAGMEFANAFTELNDPIDQRQRLNAQAKLGSAGDEEAQTLDEDFIEAMEYGMPPTGGVGIGVDRLVMLLTGQDSIKDVILFPAMRPRSR